MMDQQDIMEYTRYRYYGIGKQRFRKNIQGLSEPEFYDALVYKFTKIMGRADFPDQFRKIIICHKRIGYDLNAMRRSACLVTNPITVDTFAALFNCTAVDRASDSMMAPT